MADMLSRVKSPADVRALERAELPELAEAVRERMIDVVSRVGGHFAPGLGVVELTVALHYAFETPRDRIVWDVGHQAYPHKILTGRNEEFVRIRQKGGPSGFLSRKESEYDVFGAGHAATSISAALGIATARDLRGDDYKVVAVIGDGALTSGIAYEAMNNAGHTDRDLIVILNDNEMSISRNVGAMHKYLTAVVTNPWYNRLRDEVKALLERTGGIGGRMESLVLKMEESAKTFFTPGVLFEELGFRYVGPVDGHDIDKLVDTFEGVKKWDRPTLIHVLTTKGRGFALAERNPVAWHGAKPFDKISGEMAKKKGAPPAYTAVFGKGLVELGAQRSDVAVITAAMPSGTGTGAFGEAYPERYFDVGIAEGHGVTFAAGLATEGVRPVVAIYSTFLQRAYDSIIHDVAVQNLPVVFAMDRAGLVGNDGPTHMGLYDIAYLLAVPNMTVTAPKDGAEMLALLRLGVEHDGPFSLRYPRDNAPDAAPPLEAIGAIEYGTWEVVRRGHGLAVLATGTMVMPALDAARELESEGIDATVVNCRFIKPFDEDTLRSILARHSAILTVEEGTIVNGFGAAVARWIDAQANAPSVAVDHAGVPDEVIEHASRSDQLAACGLDAAGLARRIRDVAARAGVPPVRETA